MYLILFFLFQFITLCGNRENDINQISYTQTEKYRKKNDVRSEDFTNTKKLLFIYIFFLTPKNLMWDYFLFRSKFS